MRLTRKIVKTTISTTLILLITFAAIISMQANAQTTVPSGVTPTNVQENGSIPLPVGVTPDVTIETKAALSFTPNPIGLGQPLLVNLWIHPATHGSRYMSGYKVTFTKPDGTTDTITKDSYQADTTAWFQYTPDQVGTWKIKFEFPGGYFPAGNYTGNPTSFLGAGPFSFSQSAYYKPSSDGPDDLTVQQDMVMSWPASPLPTDYWTRPISPENREWWTIGGHYPFSGVGGGEGWPANTNVYASNYRFTPYVQAPNTAHILWSRPNEIGGLVGGQFGPESFYTGGGFGSTTNLPNIIFIGRVYQTVTKVAKVLINGTYFDQATNVWQSYDLRTGEVYWEQTGITAPPTAIFKEPATPEVSGAASDWRVNYRLVAISGGRLYKYDPITGAIAGNYSISPLTTGTIYADPYVLSVQNLGTGKGYRLINWTMAGSSNDITTRIANNVSWPFSSIGTVDYESGIAVSTYSYSSSATGVTLDVGIQAASLTTGQLLWNISSGVGYPTFSGSTAVADHGKYAVRFDDGYWYAWDLASGKKLWKSEISSWPWGSFGAYTVASAYGFIYSNAYDGISAIDWNTGKIAWTFRAPTQYAFETPYEGVYPWFTSTGVRIADGKIYAYNNEHTMSQPVSRGLRLFAINALTGEGVWNITGYMPPAAVADGYLMAANMYDGNLYTFGKGKSATTVAATPAVISNGKGVLIQGTVLDKSPAQPDTPCVSKDSMTIYMEYLHMQKPIPTGFTVTGVPVRLTATDATGKTVDIATVTSDASGSFKAAWTPPTEGLYTITASFAGDDSYGSSWTETGLSVGSAETTAPIPETVIPDYTMTIIYAAIAIILAVAIVGTLLFVTLRKR